MSLYELPKFELPKLKAPQVRFFGFWRNKTFWLLILIIFVSSVFGFLAGATSGYYFFSKVKNYLAKFDIKIPEPQKIIEKEYLPQTSQELAIIEAVKEVSPAVVSIIITKDLPIIEEYYISPFEEFFGPGSPFELKIPQYRQKGTEKKEIGGGTGFLVSEDGLVLTNKHVILDETADYTVLTNDGRQFPAKVLAKDPVQDLAILKIEKENILNEEGKFISKSFPVVKLGDSDKLQIGQTVITIGNVLGEFRNSVSVGVISGLGRKITASGTGGFVETLEDVIQTDAAINKGNSGGTLLNLKGEVIGINTAMSLEGQNIGFAIPINKAKRSIEQVRQKGKITYPFLGVRYVLINDKIQKENNLPVNYGAWVVGEKGESAIYPNSVAQKAGLKENDILLEFNGEKITTENSLAKIIMKYNPGDKITLKILREDKELLFEVILGERSE